MIGNNKCRLGKSLVVFITNHRTDTWHAMTGEETAESTDMSMQAESNTFIIAKPRIYPCPWSNDKEDISDKDAE